MLYRVEGYAYAYFTGYCRARQEIRTFRLNRVQLPPPERKPQALEDPDPAPLWTDQKNP